VLETNGEMDWFHWNYHQMGLVGFLLFDIDWCWFGDGCQRWHLCVSQARAGLSLMYCCFHQESQS
jgi:hypothetical protein